jgi:hypothetical protein
MHIEVREKPKGQRDWSDWEKCEGTDNLSEKECHNLMYQWTKEDKSDCSWLRTDYRIIGL